MSPFLIGLITYFVIAYPAARYNVRTSKRIEAAGGNDGANKWVCSPVDFWFTLLLWPICVPWFNYELGKQSPDRQVMSSWLVCAREPKQIRRREALKQLEAENNAKERELLNVPN